MAEQEAPDAGAPSGARPVATGARARRWWRRIPLRRQLLYAFVVPLAIAVLSSLFVANTLLDLREGVAATARTGETVRLRYVLLNAVADAEAGFRGYLLTGDDAFLRAYLTSPRVFETTMGRLEGMQAGDAADLRRLREAQAQFDNWRRVFAQPLLALREGAPPRVVEELRGFDAALAAGTVPPEAAATLQVMAARFPPGSARGARLARAATLLATSPRAAAIEVDAVATEVATDSAAITAAIASGRGKALLDEVRWIVNAALDEQLAELADRHAEDQVRAQDARWMALFAPIVAVLVGLGVTWLMLFDARRGIAAVA
jgi:CHASE3 domain sensor protein